MNGNYLLILLSLAAFAVADGRALEFEFTKSQNQFEFELDQKAYKLSRTTGHPPGMEYVSFIAICDPKDPENDFVSLHYQSYCKVQKATFDKLTRELRLVVWDFIPEDPEMKCMKNPMEEKVRIKKNPCQ